MLQKVKGIVIRTTDYGEANKILTIFTEDFGKIGVMARGAKKPKSRYSSVSQLFTYAHFVYQKTSGLGVLNQGESICSFQKIKSDIFLTSHSAYIVELVDRLTDSLEKNSSLFHTLLQTLNYINDGYDYEILTRIFEVKMLKLAGISPELDQCSKCGLTEGLTGFSIKEAGVLCSRCKQIDSKNIEISIAVTKLLRIFSSIDLNRLGNISVKDATKQQLKQVLDAYYEEYSGIHLKSKRFLNQIDKLKFDS